MPSIFSKLKFVDKKSRQITFGYIRTIERNLKQEIPIEVKNLCLLYFYETEEFGHCSEKLKVSSSTEDKQNDTVEQMDGTSWFSVFGKTIIDPQKTPSSIYIWKLEITAPNHAHTSQSIGILEANMDHLKQQNTKPMDLYAFNTSNIGLKYYAWATGYGETDVAENGKNQHYPYGPSVGPTRDISRKKLVNIITMELNIPKKTLRFILNDEDQGVACDDIDITRKYWLAISFAGVGFKAQILSFTSET